MDHRRKVMEKLIIRLLIKKNDQIIVPQDNRGLTKKFIFRCDKEVLEEMILSDNPKEFIGTYFLKDLYFLNFLVNLDFTEEIMIASIYVKYKDKEYDFSYMDEEWADDYWIDSPKTILSEEYMRVASVGYEYDEYTHKYGMDQENYEFKL
jgi:hypothetical protein